MGIAAAIALWAATSAPVAQDLTATYSAAAGGMTFRMKVEVAANGDLRGEMTPAGMSFVRRGGRTYYIIQRPEGPMVEDVEEVGAVMQEELARMDPQLCAAVRVAAPPARLVRRGTVTIAGRSGEAYSPAGNTRSQPEVVISRDPALAPLGAAMAAQFRLTNSVLGRCGRNPADAAWMQALLESGAALKFGPMELEKVEFAPVDPARFVLPAAPASREAIRAQIVRQGHSPGIVLIQPPN